MKPTVPKVAPVSAGKLPISAGERRFVLPPYPLTRAGEQRRVGVEIELGRLGERAIAARIIEEFGGNIVEKSLHHVVVEDTKTGKFEVYLDTAFAHDTERRNPLKEIWVELGQEIIPVEIVTPPLDFDGLDALERVVSTLREAGAVGTAQGFFLGFGVHLNPQIRSDRLSDIVPVLHAFALLEDWLRNVDPIDPSRRILPFVDPFPRGFVDAIAESGSEWDADSLYTQYLTHNPTRNRALDMLPILARLDEERVRAVVGADEKIGIRPTFHYRLPDCRIDEPGWSLAKEWNKWSLVEHVAASPRALENLSAAWLEHRAAWSTIRGDWRREVDAYLRREGFWTGGRPA